AAQRRRQAVLAGHLGDPAAARTLLADPEPAVRSTALGALQRLGALSADELAARLVDEAAPVRRPAAGVAAAWPSDATPGLVALLSDQDDAVVEVAAWACGEQDPAAAGAVARLREVATKHEDALCREAAVAALGAIGDPDALPTILEAT